MPLTNEQREQVVAEAMTWIGTKYAGWSCVKGAGVDCGQLLYGVFHNCGLIPEIPDLPKDYPLFIGLHRASTEYVDLVLKFFREIPESEVLPVTWWSGGSRGVSRTATEPSSSPGQTTTFMLSATRLKPVVPGHD